MQTKQLLWEEKLGWKELGESEVSSNYQLVLVFGERMQLQNNPIFDQLKVLFPQAQIVIASTSGDILDTQVYDNAVTATAISFEKTPIRVICKPITKFSGSYEAGADISKELFSEELNHIMVLSDGALVNGSELVKGLTSEFKVKVTGGLAGDGTRFEKTLVGLNSNPEPGNIVAIGFYGSNIRIGHGSLGGWDLFGAERLVTKSKGNVLYELDNQSALDLYKMYLGEKAKELPGSALLFPLGMKYNEDSDVLVRTILGIDEESNSMTFAGDIPEGAIVRLMKANFDKLIDGASIAAEQSYDNLNTESADLAVLISCVGRKIVLDQRIEEEVEAVREVLGKKPALAGFYSYGEISPVLSEMKCELHNQTMTITTFSEI
ncbi:MAG: FIST C-terminal domain-containing protein [Bacteroidia bacterium]|nr:FIST C-terminal domain-containing protein [Bacteroidia bacterium]